MPTAIELLVENRITGFPVIDDDWKLVGLHFSSPFFLQHFVFPCILFQISVPDFTNDFQFAMFELIYQSLVLLVNQKEEGKSIVLLKVHYVILIVSED